MGKILVIANQKGGVGKTTTAMNLSACLADMGRRTLLVDMDPQGNAGSGLGARPGDEDPSVYHALLGMLPVREVVKPGPVENLDIAPADMALIGAEVELVGHEARERHLERALSPVRDTYEHIIIDCPPSLGLLTLNSLVSADGVLVPLQCEYYALEGVLYLMHTIDRVRASYNDRLEIVGLLLTMFDTRTNLSHQVAEEVRRHFGDKVFKSVIPRNVRLAEAPSHGLPIILYDKYSRGADAYVRLTEELLRHES
ncbi:ParA family protein [bacterium]|nr:ParA family protein [candidate division CSSED10-310 bacterium]